MYKEIFFTNILRLLDEKGLNLTALGASSGVSVSFLSEITTGQANPSLKNMEAISQALNVPLPLMLTNVEPEVWASIEAMSERKPMATPKDTGVYRYISGYLPDHQAHMVARWIEATEKKRKTKSVKHNKG